MGERGESATKLAAARARLLLEHPFIGALVMHLPLAAADSAWCRTIATDARVFYYNPAYVAELSLAQAQFVLAHAMLHCALGHIARRGHRQSPRWDVACDHVVNLLLADEGLQPPPGALTNVAYRGLSAEEVYPLIPADTPERNFDRHAFDGTGDGERGVPAAGTLSQQAGSLPAYAAGNEDDATPDADDADQPAALPEGEREQLHALWQSRTAAAAQQTRLAGMPGDSWSRAVSRLLQPRLPWRALLARYMMSVARDDYSYERPSRREGDALLPRPRSVEIDLFVAVDTSGSISEAELGEFLAEVEALKGQVRARVTLHACDERLAENGPWLYAAWEPIALPEGIGGGGATRFTPVFEWIAERRLRPDLLVYFTDACGEFPSQSPEYPVIWLVKGAAGVPWGERIQLN